MSETAELVVRLADIATQINTHHREIEAALYTALERAIMAGNLLIEAKALCSHGEWLPWLEEHFEGSARTAQGYMRVASHYTLDDLKSETVSHLTYREALQALADPGHSDTDRSAIEIPETGNPYRDWLNVSAALTEIRDRELYRDSHNTFADYVRDCPGATPGLLEHMDWIDDPLMKYRALMMEELYDLWPGVNFDANGLDIPEGISFENWKRGYRILLALLGPIDAGAR